MMMQEAVKNLELVSALTDGQLHGEEFTRAIDWAARDGDGRLTWQAYHVVGDVLRAGESMVNGDEAAFMARLKSRLQHETPVLSSSDAIELVAVSACSTGAEGLDDSKYVAANDARFRWKRLAGFASLLAVASIGLLVSRAWDDQHGTAQLAQGAIQVVNPEVALSVRVDDEPQVMIRDAQLDALLAAHKQFGGTSALQVPTGFLRNATFEGDNR